MFFCYFKYGLGGYNYVRVLYIVLYSKYWFKKILERIFKFMNIIVMIIYFELNFFN